MTQSLTFFGVLSTAAVALASGFALGAGYFKLDNPDHKAFLVDEHSFSAERVDAAAKRLAGVESAKNESLEKWFG